MTNLGCPGVKTLILACVLEEGVLPNVISEAILLHRGIP